LGKSWISCDGSARDRKNCDSRVLRGGSFRNDRNNITVAVRMDAPNREPLDYYLLPRLDLTFEKLLIAEENPIGLETYRFDTLDFFFGMAQRARIPEAE